MTAVDLTDMLAALGATPDAVADQLRALGIKGDRGHPCHCPVAEYLVQSGAYRLAIVSPTGIDADTGTVRPPAPVVEFIRRFDKGIYLDLVAIDTKEPA